MILIEIVFCNSDPINIFFMVHSFCIMCYGSCSPSLWCMITQALTFLSLVSSTTISILYRDWKSL